jgi:cytochrome P450
VLEQRDPKQVSDLQIAAHASDFVLAGSETTATALSAITYYLLRTPKVMQKLKEEIRTSFQSYNAIHSKSTLDLPYLGAVIAEGLRIYPPLPIALPRVVPDGGDIVDGHFLPAGVSGCCGACCDMKGGMLTAGCAGDCLDESHCGELGSDEL